MTELAVPIETPPITDIDTETNSDFEFMSFAKSFEIKEHVDPGSNNARTRIARFVGEITHTRAVASNTDFGFTEFE